MDLPGATGPRVAADPGIPFEGLLRQDFYRVVWLEGAQWTRENLQDVDAICVRSTTRVDAALLEGTPVRFVGTATSGTDHLDLDWLAARHIPAWAAPGSNAVAVAEYLFGNLRQLFPDLLTRRPSIGVIGCGHVGQCVVRRARLLGLPVSISDPPRALAEPDFVGQPIEEVLRSEVITLHVPLTDDGPFPTRGLLDAARLALVAPGAIVVNAARGGVLDEAALVSAVRQRGVRAMLDCWVGEPRVSVPLLRAAAVATPHCAGHTLDAKQRGARWIAEALDACFLPEHTAAQATDATGPFRSADMPAESPAELPAAGAGTESPDAETYLRLLAEQVDLEAVTLEMQALAGADDDTRAAGFAAIRRRAGLRQELGLTFEDQYRRGTPVHDPHLPTGPVRVA